METAFYILLFLAHLGVFDVLYFHNYKCRLNLRPECQKEVFWHIWRHLIYALPIYLDYKFSLSRMGNYFSFYTLFF